jgi:ribosomal protein S18 acetylase RimI-like enzyme
VSVIRRLDAAELRAVLPELAAVLHDAVDGGDSVSFLDDFTIADAQAFYEAILPEVERGTRIVLAAFDGSDLVASVQLVHAWPPNSQYRAEVVKLVVHRRARGQGLGRALMERLEVEARAEGKTLLVLDAVDGGIAAGLYERLGWTRFGVVPGYALDPGGTPRDAAFFYKHL